MRLVSREFICGTGPRCTAILTSRYWLRIQSRYPDAVLRYRPYDDSNPKEDNLPAFCEAMYHGSRYHQFSNNPLVRDGLFIPALEVEYCLAVPPEHPLAAGDPSEPLQMEMLRGQCLATIRHGVSWDADQLQEELTASCPDISFAAPGDYDHALPGNCRLNCLPVIIPRLWHSMFEGFIIRDVAWKQKSSYGFYCRKDSSPMLMSILQDIASLAQQEEIACKA